MEVDEQYFRVKSSWGPTLQGSPITFIHLLLIVLLGSHNDDHRKTPLCLGQEEKKHNHFEINPESSILHNKGLLTRAVILRECSLTLEQSR
jgi:hypothetical protein